MYPENDEQYEECTISSVICGKDGEEMHVSLNELLTIRKRLK